MKRQHEDKRQTSKTHLIAPGVLAAVAIAFFIVAGFLFMRYGAAAYYAHYGKPLHLGRVSKPTVQAESLPHFDVTGIVSSATVSSGDVQTITITATSDQATKATFKAWLKYPPTNKEVWKSPKDVLISFPAGKSVTKTFSYTIPVTAHSGLYKVGVILTSEDDFTDYFVNEDLAGFTVQ
ncbi:MAG TPA: hypothetical protein VLG47_00375 [Candidatus Saccharimonadales bacterium]|nr:hypothetical protein [Candidatus Saccharimonadales bacterium]